MKKIIAMLLVFVSLFSLAACKGNGGDVETDPVKAADDFAQNQAAVEAEQSKQAAEKAAEQSEIQVEIDEYIEKVGKTKKKTQLVVELKRTWGREFHKYEFNKKGEFKTQIKYMFYDTSENYFAELEAWKNRDKAKVIDKDKDMKMLVVRNGSYNGSSFDDMYKFYTMEEVAKQGYMIIE
ncbi:MAG: hypothetical protein IJO03_02485 [Clostridia bacterium]|nr:hypothetical protein [Clostridia bacterium]MBQ7121111.1 hypothetical protein [Clostridia bacterium]